MAIADDFTIDYTDKKITYTGTFVDNIAPTRYTVNALYSFLQDTFDEAAQMDDTIPMSAQTPTQYTLINQWFMDDQTMKALYSASIQTSGWTKSGSEGITVIEHDGAGDPPITADIGETITQAVSGATGVLLDVVVGRTNIIIIRNTSTTQFDTSNTCSSTSTSGWTPAVVNSGEAIWANLFSVGTLQADTEIYVGQENDFLEITTPILTKLTSWWDSDTDFTPSTNGVAAGHFDIMVKVQEGGVFVDDLNLTNQGRLAVYARQGDTVYSHFELNGAVGNFVVPFASTGFDINQQGFGQVLIPGSFTGTFEVGEIITGDTSGAKAVLTAFVTDVSLDYVLVGKDQTEFQTAAEGITGETSGATATKDGNPPTAINGAVANGITITVGHNGTFDVDDEGTNEDYATVVDCNNNALSIVYERLMFLTRRGSVTGILPEPGSGDEDGEFYRGVGDAYITTDAEGTALTEGQTVTGSLSNATAELVAYNFSGGAGYLIVTNVKGSFVNNDVITDEGAGSITASANQVALVDVSAAPFGTFAGGRFFVARGVVLNNVTAGDNNNWQTSDVGGVARQPPTTITITFDGLDVNDRAVIIEVATSGGTDVVKTSVGLASGSVGASVIELDSTVEQDVPATGWIRVVDTDIPGKEERYEFSSISGTTVTLRTVSPGDDVANAGGSATRLVDINVGLNFGTDGNAKVGHQIRNVTDGSEAVILRRVSDNEIETTPLTGGVSNDWATSDAYEINTVAFLIDTADTCYFPFIDDTVESGSSLSKSIKFAATTEIVVRTRFSDPDVGGTRILPFEQLSKQITNADLTVTAIRTPDTIVT